MTHKSRTLRDILGIALTNKDANELIIYLGNDVDTNIFTTHINSNVYNKINETYLFLTNKQINFEEYYHKNLCYRIDKIDNSKSVIKTKMCDFKKIELNEHIDLFIQFNNTSLVNDIEFPCKYEYHNQKKETGMSFNINEKIRIEFTNDIEDNNYVYIVAKIDAYIDNTIDKLIETLKNIALVKED